MVLGIAQRCSPPPSAWSRHSGRGLHLARAITGYRQNGGRLGRHRTAGCRDLDVRRAVRHPAAQQRGERAAGSVVKLGDVMASKIKEGGGDDLEENSEINVTLFIDVMLVLLIIFMVAAPLATVDIVDLPSCRPADTARGQAGLHDAEKDLRSRPATARSAATLSVRNLDAVTEGNKDTRILLRADKAVDYGSVMDVMNLLRGAGYAKIALSAWKAHRRNTMIRRALTGAPPFERPPKDYLRPLCIRRR